MPRGMCLKSEGFASNLYDPESAFTLETYCKREGIPYADVGLPVPLEVFTAYGLEFQKRFIPNLEEKQVVTLERLSSGFRLTLDDGDTCDAEKVVVATGISHFASVPDVLAKLPEEFVTHSAKNADLSRFKGKDVTVLGAGSSAIDIAALLGKAGATARLVARTPKFKFNDTPKTRMPSWIESIRRPRSGLGPGWKSRLCTDAPLLFRVMPERFRLWIVRRHLGPVAGWFVKKDIEGIVTLLPSTLLVAAEIRGSKLALRLAKADGTTWEIETDHVIAATGYKPDLRRLAFLDDSTRASIKSVEHTPILSSHFESSVPGLYFTGLVAANTFGPMLRFAYGAGFTSRRLSRHLRRAFGASVGRSQDVLASRAKASS